MKSDSLHCDNGEMGTFASSMETRRTICEMGEEKGLVAAILEARVQLQLAPRKFLGWRRWAVGVARILD